MLVHSHALQTINGQKSTGIDLDAVDAHRMAAINYLAL